MSTAEATASGGAEQAFHAALARGQFLIQRCGACAHAVFYPRLLCPHCGADHLDWIEPSGRGQVYSTTVVRRKPEAGGDYNVALIDLDEGVRMMSCVTGVAPEAVGIGMRVRARVNVSGTVPRVEFTQEAV